MPIGNTIAESVPALSWIGWVSRELMSGAGLGYIVGVVAGGGLYVVLRYLGAKRANV